MFTAELTGSVRTASVDMHFTSCERPDASIQVRGDADAVRESGRRRRQTQGTLFLTMVSADKMTHVTN